MAELMKTKDLQEEEFELVDSEEKKNTTRNEHSPTVSNRRFQGKECSLEIEGEIVEETLLHGILHGHFKEHRWSFTTQAPIDLSVFKDDDERLVFPALERFLVEGTLIFTDPSGEEKYGEFLLHEGRPMGEFNYFEPEELTLEGKVVKIDKDYAFDGKYRRRNKSFEGKKKYEGVSSLVFPFLVGTKEFKRYIWGRFEQKNPKNDTIMIEDGSFEEGELTHGFREYRYPRGDSETEQGTFVGGTLIEGEKFKKDLAGCVYFQSPVVGGHLTVGERKGTNKQTPSYELVIYDSSSPSWDGLYYKAYPMVTKTYLLRH